MLMINPLDDLKEMLQGHAKEVFVPRNQYLFQCGDSINSLYLVLEGEMRALRHQPGGQKSIMMRATDGEFFAAASLTLDRYPCDGCAALDSTLLAIRQSDFTRLMDTTPKLARYFGIALSYELKKQCGRLERLRLPTVRERILHYVNCETRDGCSLQLDFPLTLWAEELGVHGKAQRRGRPRGWGR